MHYMHQHL